MSKFRYELLTAAQKQDVDAVARRIDGRVLAESKSDLKSFDPTWIVSIVTLLSQLWSNCKNDPDVVQHEARCIDNPPVELSAEADPEERFALKLRWRRRRFQRNRIAQRIRKRFPPFDAVRFEIADAVIAETAALSASEFNQVCQILDS